MTNILDNPVWNALITSNSQFAEGSDIVKFFPGDIGPFAGSENFNEQSLGELHELIPPKRVVAIVTPERLQIPGYWKMIEMMNALQMIYEGQKFTRKKIHDIVPLENRHVPEMIALAKLTNPGPFRQRTIEFGNYMGIFKSDHLVAMAGWRMHPYHYIEISAVCTHPDHTGKGYGKSLLIYQVNQIKAAGSIPFLHVKAGNENAVNLYKHLGFTVRSEMNIYVIRKTDK